LLNLKNLAHQNGLSALFHSIIFDRIDSVQLHPKRLFSTSIFYLLQRKNYAILYLIMSLLALYLEIVGTQLGTWYWHSNWWLFTTINPPVGAIVIYIAGDMLLKKLTTLHGKKMSKTV